MPTRVLIADPDESLLAVYRDFLSRNGFDVVTATDGLTCLDALRRVEPDVLVLELDMPWGGGTGVLEVMHESSDVPLVPVLALTSRRDPDSFEEATAFKMLSRYHVKPLASDQLAKLIRTIQEESLFPEERLPAVLAEAGRRAKRRTHVRTRHALLSTIVRPRSPRSPEQPAAALSGS
jgi:DNA-binding response OmpR family regulator